MDRLLLHLLLLAWASIAAAGRLTPRNADRFLAAAVLAWANLVATSLLLGMLHRLGESRWFFGVSALLAGLTCLLAWWTPRAPAPAGEEKGDRPDGRLLAGFLFTLAPLAGAILATAYIYVPNNPDALTAHLPRALFYLGQGHLGHFETGDARPGLLPLNHELLQLFGLRYGALPQCLNFFNVLAWTVAGTAVYRLGRLNGSGADPSLIATWLALVAPPVIAQAAATTPELPAGAALLGAAVFAVRWRQDRRKRDALLAILAAGLATDGVRQLGSGGLTLPDIFPTRPGLNEDTVGFGLVGIGLLLAAIFCVYRFRRPAGITGWCARLGLAWIAASVLLHLDSPFSPRPLLPAALLLSPCLAATIHAAWPGRGRLTAALLLITTLATGWSAGTYLLDNTRRPFRPVLDPGARPPAVPPLPAQLDQSLARQSWINIDTDGAREALFPLMALRPGHRFTARQQPEAEAYNLLSRSSLSHQAGLQTIAERPCYTVIPFPGKPTAGVEFLATLGHRDAEARDYFGLIPRAGQTASIGLNQFLLVTVAIDHDHPGPGRIQIRVAGLNPADGAQLTVAEETADHHTMPLATFTRDGAVAVTMTGTDSRVNFRALAVASGAELTAAIIPSAAREGEGQRPRGASLPANPNALFATDLVLADDPHVTASDGLLPTEGPFPQWNLPYVRWAKKSTIQLRIPPVPQLARLQLHFSLRLHVRATAGLEVRLNGTVVQQYRITNPNTWLDQTLELTPQPGANVVEFRDVPLNSEPDWLEYLERYPDVKDYLLAHNMPLEEGAREHYEVSGRPEGREIRLRAISGPENSFYFMFRNLRLEGFKSP